MITGVHLAHVVFGWIATVFLLIWVALGYFNRVRHLPITIGVLYWYFLGATYLGVFLVLDVTPFLA
jgi:heme/copper-type cytochrome/quinol oxidase subunit 3